MYMYVYVHVILHYLKRLRALRRMSGLLSKSVSAARDERLQPGESFGKFVDKRHDLCRIVRALYRPGCTIM